MKHSIDPLLFFIPGIYLVFVLLIGIYLAKKQSGRADFYVASGGMGGAVLFSTILSTVVGANTYLGFSGRVYTHGFSSVWLLAAAGMAYFLLYFLCGRIRRIASEYQVFTLPDLMEVRYNTPVALVVTLFSLVALVGGAGGSILGIGLIAHTALGIDTTTAIIVTAVITIAYTTFGGLWGVAVTDWLQTLIMIIGLILVVAFGFPQLSPDTSFIKAFSVGSSELSQRLGANSLSLTSGVTFPLVLTWAITFMPLNTISQTQIQRVYAARSAAVLRRISLLMVIVVSLLMAFTLALVGTLGAAITPGLNNPETVFPVMALQVINPVVGMIVVTGILGASMSTTDSNLLGAGIHVSRDLAERIRRIQNRDLSETTSLRIARASILVIGILSTLAAVTTPSILTLLLVTLQLFAGATFIPILAGLFWQRANNTGAMLAIFTGGGSTLLATLFQTTTEPLLIGILCSILGLLAGVLIGRKNSKQIAVKSLDFNPKSELPWFVAVAGFFALFFWAVGQPENWPWIVAFCLIALSICVILLIVFFFTDLKSRLE